MNKENSLLILLLICNALIGGAVGQYETKFLGKAYGDTDPVGVVVNPDGNSIFVNENRAVAAERNYIAEIKYTGTDVPTVSLIEGTGTKPDLKIVKDPNVGGKFFLELLNELDYENSGAGTWSIQLDPKAPNSFIVAPRDIDDMDPSFTEYALTALKSDEGDFSSDKVLFTYKATDPDTVDVGKLTYALTDLDNSANTPFVIDSITGELRQTAALDYQLQSVYRLQMTVTDSDGVNAISAPSVTLVNVNDLPNQPPRWVSVNPVLQVAENNDPATDPALFKYGAVDGDTMVNSPIKYYLEGVPVDPISSTPYLTIDEASGEIRVNVVLDAEQIEDSTFTFQVVAEEMINTVPNLKIQETVTFFILDQNDNRPIFEDGESEKTFQVVIDENTSGSLPGLEQLIIIDKDRDLAYNEYVARLKADDPDTEMWVNEMFSVTPSKGYGGGTFVVQIKPSTVINYEDAQWQKPIQFYVTVEEASDPQRFARGAISLTVKDLNDNSPVFGGVDANGEIVVEVSEGIPIGQTVATILATDEDISAGFGSASVRYFWGVPAPNDLEIDAVTGIVATKTNSPFDRELMPQEVYIVNAVDSENEPNARKTSAVLRLVIQDVNDEPPLITTTSRQITIQENTKLDFVFEGIQVTDPDEKPVLEIECTVEGPTETQGWFRCESTRHEPGGMLIAKILLAGTELPNYEVTNRVDIEMKASDGVQFSVEMFTVFITNLNDEYPVFDDIGEISYTETEVCAGNDCESESRREIHQFRVQDKDSPPSEIQFSITSKDPGTLNLVEINPTNGILSRKVGAVIDREKTAILYIDVTAHNLICDDNGCTHDPIIFTTEEDVPINIEDINDEIPVFEDSPTEFTTEENESSGDIHTFVATDKDAGRFGEVVYSLDENYLEGHGLDKFEINENTGVLSIKAQLDRETDAQYALRIVARDNGGSQSNSNDGERIITIFIKDVNDNAPQFSNIEFPSKSEDQISPEMELGKLQLHDIDEAGTQNSLVGAELVGVTYVDCPNCDILMMNWRDHFEGLFEGATNTFRIYAKTKLYPYFGKFSFEVFAYDYGTPMASFVDTLGPLEITDVNDHTPVVFFPTANENTHVYIAENHPILGQGNDVAARLTEHNNTQVRALAGDDLDDPNLGNGQITFLIDQNGEGYEYFDVVPGDEDGIFYIAVRAQLVVDEQGVPLRVGIIAKDNGTPPKQSEPQIMLISVVPESNQEPIFVGENAEVHIQENATLPAPIVLLAASDLDTIGDDPLDRFGYDICYYIIAGDTTQSFQLDEYTNTLTLKQGLILDREHVPTYKLSILAKNEKPTCQPPTSVPPLDSPSVLNVQIIVDDVKDTAPRFVDLGTCSGGVRTSTAEIGSSTSIVLRGEEDDLNDPITFTIDDKTLERSDPSLAGIQDPVFTISETNEILINFQANEAMKGYFTFTVFLTDSEEMQATQMCKVYLTTPDNYVEFQFDDGYEEFTDSIISQVETIMSENYGYLCNIDKVRNTTDENGNAFAGKTTIETHFIDESKTEPVPSYLITDLPYDEPEKFINLTAALRDIGLNLDIKSYYEEPVDETQGILTYILVGAVIVLTIVVVFVSVSCWFNSRRLSLRVRALTASTFGSQESGLNRTDSFKLPNTNQHAVQGSNPVWATEGAMRALDTESVGSGGSVLIGLENDEDFKNYAAPEREDDFSFAFGPERTQGTFNPIFGANFGEDDADEKETQDHADEKETQDHSDEKETQDPVPSISGTIVGRRNPLSMQNFDDDE